MSVFSRRKYNLASHAITRVQLFVERLIAIFSGMRNKGPTIITAITKFNRLIRIFDSTLFLEVGFSGFSTRTASKFDLNPGHSRNAVWRFSQGFPRSVARRNMHEGDHRDGDPCSLSGADERKRARARALMFSLVERDIEFLFSQKRAYRERTAYRSLAHSDPGTRRRGGQEHPAVHVRAAPLRSYVRI